MTAKGRTVGPKQMTLLNMFGRQGSGKAASETNGDSAEIVNNAEQNEHPSDEVTESCTPNVQEPLPPPESASQAKDVRDDDVNENSSGLSKWPLRVQGNGVRKNRIFSIFEKPQKSADSPASVVGDGEADVGPSISDASSSTASKPTGRRRTTGTKTRRSLRTAKTDSIESQPSGSSSVEALPSAIPSPSVISTVTKEQNSSSPREPEELPQAALHHHIPPVVEAEAVSSRSGHLLPPTVSVSQLPEATSSAMKGHAPTPSPSTDSLEPKDSDEAMAINSSIQEPNLASGISGSQPNSQTRIRRNPSRKSRPVHPIVALSPEPVAPPPILEVRTPSPPLLITIEDTPVASERNYLPGGSQEDPITVESSPVKIRALPPASDFFAPRPRSIAPVFRTPPTRNASPGIQTPLPSAESQHVKGVQSKFGVPLTLLNRFDHANLSPTRYDENPPLESLRRPPSFIDDIPKQFHVRRIHTPEEQETFHAQTPLSHRIHPAISRFTTSNLESHGTNDKPQEMWNEKWRPRRAVEVLGNESSAEYLKAWLRALAVQFHPQAAAVDSSTANGVQGVKRKGTSKPLYGSQIKQPSVVRAVGKRQRKRARVDSDDDDILDFIATDDDGWESACETSEDEMEVNDASSSEMNDTTNDGVMSPPPRLTRLRRGHRPEPDTLDVNIDDTVQPENRPLPPSSPPPRPSSATYDFSHYLTNTILLTGPTGAGKTAAVYACATELGWQVFEVHPGTGKRNGANLHALVGDVGKNHMVGAAPSRVNGATLFGGARTPVLSQGDSVKSEKGTVNATQSIHALFSKGRQVAIKDQGLEDNSTNKQPETLKSKTAGFGFLSSHHDSLHEDGDASATPRQSIILLEEVDILFNEDANFWPAVVNLIKTSRRPVILTCNDPSLVPLSDLPVQTTLTFIPCPTPLATSYLHSLAVQEDYIVSQDLLTSTYELTTQAPTSTDLTEDFALAVNSGPFRTFDLRRAINGLQILCQSIPHDGEVASNDIRSVEKSDSQRPALDVHAPLTTSAPVMGTALRDLRDLERLTETASFMDSEVQQRSLAALEVFIVDDDNSSIDEEQGFTTLHNVASGKKEVDGVIALYSVADYIAQEGLFLATKSVVSDGRCGAWTPFTAGDLFYGRREHWTQIGDVLDRVVGGYGVISPSTLVLDYEPYVRWMVRVDDEVDSRWMESRGVERRWGRATRNSQRQEYARYVNLGHEHRRTLSNTAFRVEDTFCDDRR